MRIQGGMAAHVNAQIRVDAPNLPGHAAAKILHKGHGKFTDIQGRRDIHILKPGPDLVKIRHMGGQVFCILPAPLQDQGDHGLHEQGVGSRPQGQMDIGQFGRLAPPGVNDHQGPIRVPGNFF